MQKTIQRDHIAEFLNNYLNCEKIKDASRNGIQVEGKAEVKKIAFGVSASLKFIEKAAACGADMAIVHHGLIWNEPQRLHGWFGKRIEQLYKTKMSLLGYHLPLDKHEKCGNNAQILGYFNAASVKPFGQYHDEYIGFKGKLPKPLTPEQLCSVLNKKLDCHPKTAAFGNKLVRTLGVVSGGAADMIIQAAEEKLDAFITGESYEPAWEIARETHTNFIAAGHYNTEKAGVLALMKILSGKFGLKTEFIDVQNPF